MDTLPIKTEADYDRALSEIEPYFSNPPPFGTAAATRFNVLAEQIESYEAHHWTIEPPDPVAAIRTRMERSGYSQVDLARQDGPFRSGVA